MRLNVDKFHDTAPLTPRKVGASCSHLACEQALLFGRAKGSRLRSSLAPSRETRFARPNRRACSQASE